MTNQLTPYTNYQLSAIGVGVIAVGLADIRQCINIILKTVPGSDPLRPLFGCGIYEYIDAPVSIAVPNMKQAIFEALDIWEPRINVMAITHEIINENVIFSISYRVIDSEINDTLQWSAINGPESELSLGIILTAQIPIKSTGNRYSVSFLVDGNNALPLVPKFGFDTRLQLINWLVSNWFNYGKWYLTSDKIVLYMAPNIVKFATLSITQTQYLTRTTELPELLIGEFYNLELTLPDTVLTPPFPIETLSTPEELITWLLLNWGDYGDFSILNGSEGGDFDSDFDSDFYTGSDGHSLVFKTNLFTTATLTFI